MSAKVDLQVHTKFSHRSAEWILRRLDFPASCTEPTDLYALLKKRGMKFVTFTDNNTISGCLEIADRPDVFISEKVTAYFPEDGCKIQILAWGITESQHADIQKARESIYVLQRYLADQGIAHAVAHPLYNVNQKLTLHHIEKLLLLFKHFEGINGLRDSLLSQTLSHIVSSLTPHTIEQIAAKHGIQPTHPEPWRKVLTAGSDDHGGIFPASAYTEADSARSPSEFLDRVRRGDCRPCGSSGSPLTVSHSLYNIFFQFAKSKFSKSQGPTLQLVERAFSRFMEGEDPTEFSWKEKIGFIAQGIASGKIFELAKPGGASLWKELSSYLDDTDFKSLLARNTSGIEEPERRAFIMANLLANQLAYRFFDKTVREISSGGLIEAVQSASAMVPVLLLLSPYIYAFQSQSPNRSWLANICDSLTGSRPDFLENQRRAWFTDTLDDVNGVATTIRRMSEAALTQGRDLTIVTCSAKPATGRLPLKNFQPIGEFELPEYELQKLSFPPILEIIDYVQREKFTEIIISTPGPLGLAALLAAKMLSLPTTSIYHTDFPQYVRILTDDSFLETLTWHYMQWFYGQCDTVFVNSRHYLQCWSDRGIPSDRLHILPRGLDLETFSPTRRNPSFWTSRGATPGELILLFVGRLSKEKDLDVLVKAYNILTQHTLSHFRLAFVGDGPYRQHLENELPDAIFTGYLSGIELATAYASADIFVFPSTTDTFGNVILEAHASGLPCIVSNEGGPAELVQHGHDGLITPAHNPNAFAKAIEQLLTTPHLLHTMRQAAVQAVRDRDWLHAFRAFWDKTSTPPR